MSPPGRGRNWGNPVAHCRNTTHTHNNMILHTITCTKFQPAFQAHEQFTLHLTRIVRIAAELSDEITFAIDDGDTAKVEALNPWLINLKEWIEKNQKLHTKMRAAGLGD